MRALQAGLRRILRSWTLPLARRAEEPLARLTSFVRSVRFVFSRETWRAIYNSQLVQLLSSKKSGTRQVEIEVKGWLHDLLKRDGLLPPHEAIMRTWAVGELEFRARCNEARHHWPHWPDKMIHDWAAFAILAKNHKTKKAAPLDRPFRNPIPQFRRMFVFVALIFALCGVVRAEPTNVVNEERILAAWQFYPPHFYADPQGPQVAVSHTQFYNGSNWVNAASGTPLPITCVSGCSAGGAFTDNSAFSVGVTSISPVGAYYTTGAAPALSSGNAGRIRMDANSYLYVDCITGCSASAGFSDNTAFTAGTTAINITGGWYSTSPTNCTTGNACAPQLTVDRKLFVQAFQGTSPWVVSLASTTITGTVAVTQSTSPWIVAGAKTPADAYANPTDAEDSFSLLAGWDATNTNWRRLQVDAATGTLKVDGSGSTQPVSCSNCSGTVTVGGTVTSNQGGAPWSVVGTLTDNNATPAANNVGVLPCRADTNSRAVTVTDQVLLSCDANDLLRVSLKDTPANTNNLNVNIAATGVTQPVSGTVTANQGTAAAGTAGWPGISGNVAESTAAWTTSTGANAAVTLTITNYGTTVVSLNQGTTITGGVVTFEVSDTTAFTNAYPIECFQGGTETAVPTYTLIASTNQGFTCDTAGWAAFRVRLSTTISGTATVNVGVAAISNPSPRVVVVAQDVAADLNATVTGTVTANAGTGQFNVTCTAANCPVNVAQFGGNAVVTGTGASGTGIPRVTVSNDSSILGTKTNNNAAPGATNFGVLPAIANAATQAWTEGDQVAESVDLSGRQRIVGISGDNGVAATTNRAPTLPSIYQTSYLNGTAATQGRDGALSQGTDGLLWTAQLPSIRPASYHASASYAGSSTTFNAHLAGNATNTVLVTKIMWSCTQTTAGLLTVTVNKTSAASTGGTAATMTAVPDDSNYAAASSVAQSFTGTGPTAGTPVGQIDAYKVGCMATGTASPNDIYILNLRQKPIVLRGTAQTLEIGVGAAITGGNVTTTFEWMETATITP